MITKRVVIEGIDKTGKDLLLKYIDILSNHKYDIQSRGIISLIAYSTIFDRNYKYDLSHYKDDIIVYLTADFEDLKVRHKVNDEPKIDIIQHKTVFDNLVEQLQKQEFTILSFNTSEMTPYTIAKAVLGVLKQYE